MAVELNKAAIYTLKKKERYNMKKILILLAFAAIAVNSITAFPWSKKAEKNPSEKTETVAANDEFYTVKTDRTLDESKRKTLGEISYIAPENNFKIKYENTMTPSEFYKKVTDIYYSLQDDYPTEESIDKMVQDMKKAEFPLQKFSLWNHDAKNYKFKLNNDQLIEFRFSFPVLECSMAEFDNQYGGDFDVIFATDSSVYRFCISPDYALKDFEKELSAYIQYTENGGMGPGYYWVNQKNSMSALAEAFMKEDPSLPEAMHEFKRNFDSFLKSIRFEGNK